MNPGILLPHPNECCARGHDDIAEGRTYVVHDNGTTRWGFTVLHDGVGTIVDRWGGRDKGPT